MAFPNHQSSNKRKQDEDRLRAGSYTCPYHQPSPAFCPVHGRSNVQQPTLYDAPYGGGNNNCHYQQHNYNRRRDDDDDDCCGVKEPCSCCQPVPDCCPSKCPVPDCCPCPPPVPKAIYPPCCPMPPKCGGTCPTPNPCPCKGCVAPEPPPPCPTPTPPFVPIPPCGCVPFIKPRPSCCCPPCCIPEPCAPPPPPPLCPPPKLCDCDRGMMYDDAAPSQSNQSAAARRSATGCCQMDLDSMIGQSECPECCRAVCPNCKPPPPCKVPCQCIPSPCCDADFCEQCGGAEPAAKRGRMDDSVHRGPHCSHQQQQQQQHVCQQHQRRYHY